MDLEVLPLHQNPEYLMPCCKLINSEWKRSDTARLRSLEASCDTLPTSLILVQNKNVIGHSKISKIPSIPDACFIESVVIDINLRGKGYGKYLMIATENYCKNCLQMKTIFLTTKGQEGFYSKLGYKICEPISIYGSSINSIPLNIKTSNYKYCNYNNVNSPPVPPPLPKNNPLTYSVKKSFMNKSLN